MAEKAAVRGDEEDGGAAGSRTRVPRSQHSGLYVRRFRISLGFGAPAPDSFRPHITKNVPRGQVIATGGVKSLVMTIRPSYEASEADRAEPFRPRA